MTVCNGELSVLPFDVLQVHFLYQYSLRFILDIFQVVLNSNTHLSGVTDHFKRLSIITADMFQVRGGIVGEYQVGGAMGGVCSR